MARQGPQNQVPVQVSGPQEPCLLFYRRPQEKVASLHLLALGAVLIANALLSYASRTGGSSSETDAPLIVRIFHLCSHVSCLVSLTIQAVLGNDPFTQEFQKYGR